MLALFRDYDVVWPGPTEDAFGWFDLANFGFLMLAPGALHALHAFLFLCCCFCPQSGRCTLLEFCLANFGFLAPAPGALLFGGLSHLVSDRRGAACRREVAGACSLVPPLPHPDTLRPTHAPHLSVAGCTFGGVNFYYTYVFQMALPAACVALCVLAYYRCAALSARTLGGAGGSCLLASCLLASGGGVGRRAVSGRDVQDLGLSGHAVRGASCSSVPAGRRHPCPPMLMTSRGLPA